MSISFLSRKANLHNILDSFEELPFQFYIAGSRYMKINDNLSDWDFIVEDSKEVRKALYKMGFIYSQTTSCYLDSNCNAVMVHREPNIPIHIQLSNDIELRLAAQLIIKESGLGIMLHQMKRYYKTPNEYTTKIWNTIFTMLQGGYDNKIKELLNNVGKDEII